MSDLLAFFRKNDTFKKEIPVFASTVSIGIFVHLYILTNHITLHDNVYSFYWGGTIGLGRWGLYLLWRFTNLWNGNYLHYAPPAYLGVLSVIYIALAAVLVMKILKIQKAFFGALLGVIMVTFPVVTAIFGFMFTSAAYFFGMLVGVMGVWLITSKEGVLRIFIGVILIGFATGVYQAFLPFFGGLFLLDAIQRVRNGQKSRFFSYMLTGFLSAAFYAVCMKLFLVHYNTELSDYQGIGLVSSTGPLAYLSQILCAYKEFFDPTKWARSTVYLGSLRILYYVMLLCLCLFLICDLVKRFREGVRTQAAKQMGMYVLIPLMANGIFVMSASSPDTVHSLMMYGELLPFFALLVFLDEEWGKDDLPDKLKKCGIAAGTACLILFSIISWRLANISYWKADYVQEASAAYFTRLVMRMEEVPGYSGTTTAVFIGDPVTDEHTLMYGEFDLEIGRFPYGLWPYNLTTMVQDYNWLAFMRSETGFGLGIGNAADWKDCPEVQAMPCYPEPGSVIVVDDLVIVKFCGVEWIE